MVTNSGDSVSDTLTDALCEWLCVYVALRDREYVSVLEAVCVNDCVAVRDMVSDVVFENVALPVSLAVLVFVTGSETVTDLLRDGVGSVRVLDTVALRSVTVMLSVMVRSVNESVCDTLCVAVPVGTVKVTVIDRSNVAETDSVLLCDAVPVDDLVLLNDAECVALSVCDASFVRVNDVEKDPLRGHSAATSCVSVVERWLAVANVSVDPVTVPVTVWLTV